MRTPEELSAFIKKRLHSGYPDGELRNDLLKEGYTIEEIDRAFFNASPFQRKPNTSKRVEYPAWYIFSISSIILALGLMVQFGVSPLSLILLIPGLIGVVFMIVKKMSQ